MKQNCTLYKFAWQNLCANIVQVGKGEVRSKYCTADIKIQLIGEQVFKYHCIHGITNSLKILLHEI
jgi:hypothetical protein